MPVDARIWTLLGLLVDVFEGITTANGYRTEIGGNVSRELLQLDTELEDTFGRVTLMVDGRIAVKTISTQRRVRVFQVFAEINLNADETDSQERAHAALQDMIEVIPGKTRYAVDTGIDADVELDAAEILTRRDGMPCIALRLEYGVTMQENLSA